jgi:hypothetical protein
MVTGASGQVAGVFGIYKCLADPFQALFLRGSCFCTVGLGRRAAGSGRA